MFSKRLVFLNGFLSQTLEWKVNPNLIATLDTKTANKKDSNEPFINSIPHLIEKNCHADFSCSFIKKSLDSHNPA